jgi:hypothetical protein
MLNGNIFGLTQATPDLKFPVIGIPGTRVLRPIAVNPLRISEAGGSPMHVAPPSHGLRPRTHTCHIHAQIYPAKHTETQARPAS